MYVETHISLYQAATPLRAGDCARNVSMSLSEMYRRSEHATRATTVATCAHTLLNPTHSSWCARAASPAPLAAAHLPQIDRGHE
jgi:hypothetical protein